MWAVLTCERPRPRRLLPAAPRARPCDQNPDRVCRLRYTLHAPQAPTFRTCFMGPTGHRSGAGLHAGVMRSARCEAGAAITETEAVIGADALPLVSTDAGQGRGVVHPALLSIWPQSHVPRARSMLSSGALCAASRVLRHKLSTGSGIHRPTLAWTPKKQSRSRRPPHENFSTPQSHFRSNGPGDQLSPNADT